QVLGDETVGAASDIYSLGATLFEMLAGRPPFVTDGPPTSVAIQHVTQPPPSLASLGIAVPASIEAAIKRALAKDPDDRFPSAAAFAAALETTTVGPGATTEIRPAPLASVVVLPLANVSGDQESEYLSDGITEELIGALARVGG